MTNPQGIREILVNLLKSHYDYGAEEQTDKIDQALTSIHNELKGIMGEEELNNKVVKWYYATGRLDELAKSIHQNYLKRLGEVMK